MAEACWGYGVLRIQRGAGVLYYADFRTERVLMATVLIVEDELFVRQAADWTIGDLGHQTLLASNLSEALAHLAVPNDIGALFVDIRLSTLALGGYDVANQARAFKPGLLVLYTSGSPLTADMTDLFVGGGQFIQKPYSPKELETSVAELFQ